VFFIPLSILRRALYYIYGRSSLYFISFLIHLTHILIYLFIYILCRLPLSLRSPFYPTRSFFFISIIFITNTKPTKRYRKELDPDEQIVTTLYKGSPRTNDRRLELFLSGLTRACLTFDASRSCLCSCF